VNVRVSGTPVASALSAAGSLDAARVLARSLVAGTILAVLALVFVPWQQNVPGRGRVIAYAPVERRQPIEAPMTARVVRWYVQEGQRVEAGDVLVELSDNDPALVERLERQLEAVEAQIDAATLAVAVAEAKIAALESARAAAVSGATLRREIAEDRLAGARRKVDAARAALRTAELNRGRQRRLHEAGLASTRARELAELKVETARAELDQALAALDAAEREVAARAAARDEKAASLGAKLEEARRSLQKARSDRAKAEAERTKIEVALARQRTMRVPAPRGGTIFRVVARQGGEIVKQGDPLAVLVPDTEDRAVALWVDGNDAPLITPGRHVRVQFEGWPAVQFVGWPSVAVGTFGGTVAFVDATDDGNGRFRVVVVPDANEPWPDPRYLRQGVRANGWILLNRVPLGFELWRQFNGFPPAIQAPGDGGGKRKEGEP